MKFDEQIRLELLKDISGVADSVVIKDTVKNIIGDDDTKTYTYSEVRDMVRALVRMVTKRDLQLEDIDFGLKDVVVGLDELRDEKIPDLYNQAYAKGIDDYNDMLSFMIDEGDDIKNVILSDTYKEALNIFLMDDCKSSDEKEEDVCIGDVVKYQDKFGMVIGACEDKRVVLCHGDKSASWVDKGELTKLSVSPVNS